MNVEMKNQCKSYVFRGKELASEYNKIQGNVGQIDGLTCGLAKSSERNPVARNMARAPLLVTPSTTVAECGLGRGVAGSMFLE